MPQLVSLWELMKSFRLTAVLELAKSESRLTAIIEDKLLPNVDAKEVIVEDWQRKEIRQLARRISQDFAPLGLTASTATLRRVRKFCDSEQPNFEELQRLYKEFMGRFYDETAALAFLSIEPSKSRYFEQSNLFGEAVASRFPDAIVDIEEAGKCLALDRSTASVFHVMRALEMGLQEFGTKLGIQFADMKNWQKLLNDVQGAINRLPQTTAAEKEYLGKCQAVHAHLQAVKDAWRNDVMHPRVNYTPEQAIDIFGHASALMRKLADFV